MVFRTHKTKNYTIMSNYHLKDKSLSLKAKGLLSMMLSLPDDWEYSKAGLVSVCKEGETTINTALKELEESKYLKIEKINSKDGFSYVYNIYECPQVETPDLETPCLGNQGQLNTKEQNTNKQKVSKDTCAEHKKNLYQQCLEYIDTEFVDTEVKNLLVEFLKYKLSVQKFNAKQFRTIILELRDLADNKETAVAVIQNALDKKLTKFFPVYKKKNRYSDNLANVQHDDEYALLEQYRKEFAMTFEEDMPTFEEWKKERQK